MIRPIIYVTLTVFLAATSCQTAEMNKHPTNKKATAPRMLVGNFDTAQVTAQLAILERAARLDLLTEKQNQLPPKPDTLELTYYFNFCDCQHWVLTDIHKKAKTQHADLDALDARGQVEFNLDEHGYYIEPAHPELEIDWRAMVNGTTIRFIGREYPAKRLPENGAFTVPNPPPGKVLRYYSYEILRPYCVWGPAKFEEVDAESGDSVSATTILTVR